MRIWLLFIAALGAAFSTPSAAASIVQNVSGSQRGGTTLNLFDPTLGSLDSVQVEGTVGYSAGLFRGFFDPTPPAVSIADTTNVGVGVGDAGSGVSFASGNVTGFEIYNEGSAFGSMDLSGPLFALLTGATVNPFIAGSENTSLIVPQFGPYPPTVGGLILNPASPSATYSLKITYNYSSVSVPEPSTWAMMLLGFATIGIVARRQGLAGNNAASLGATSSPRRGKLSTNRAAG